MLKQQSRLWLLFGLCLLMILPAMIWLSVKAVKTDHELQRDRRETELARQEAEVQEKITSALYRMDWKLGPHIAREAARPYYLYEAFYSRGNPDQVSDDAQVPSPLLSQTSDFVKLHFQIAYGNEFTSPQRPSSLQDCKKAYSCGVSFEAISERDKQLNAARQLGSYESILAQTRPVGQLFDSNLDQIKGNVFVQTQAFNFANKFQLQEQVEQSMQANQSANGPPDFPPVKPGSKSEVQKRRGASRGGREFVQRFKSYNDNSSQWALEAKPSFQSLKSTRQLNVAEGVMRPIWIGDNLLLSRIVRIDEQDVIQCCWLEWDKIKEALREEVRDILPEVDFEPVTNDEMLVPGRALVTLPVQVVVDSQQLLANSVIGTSTIPSRFSGLQVALFVAWIGLILSAFAIGSLLYGVMQLSERRASFVSAVTHELRTPLTTFKMYSEMLAEKMVPEEKQVQYAQTLKLQADRLSHLVENVLQFARLERGADRRTIVAAPMETLLAGIESRLIERARQSNQTVTYEIQESLLSKHARVEPHAIEQILFNLVDNACKYAKNSDKATIDINGRLRTDHLIELSVRDYGPGVSGRNSNRIFQPFSKSDLEAANSEPGVGLGLSLCQRMAASFKGRIYYENCDPGVRFILEIPVASQNGD